MTAVTNNGGGKDAALEALTRGIEQALTAAAEPLIAEALKRIETAMRQRVAEAAIGLIRHQYDIRMDAQHLLISVRLENLNPSGVRP